MSIERLLNTLNKAKKPFPLADIMESHPEISRRTLQRWLAQLLAENKIVAYGQGRARRFQANPETIISDHFPKEIPLSPISQEILNYVNQPLSSRKPVGYQSFLLDDYQPNKTYYLTKNLRDQLKNIGNTQETRLPAGTYGRQILNRLLIDLSWASSHLEGNTYSLLETQQLIEYGKAAKNKTLFETQMILNHKASIEFLITNAKDVQLNTYTLFNLHHLLSENLLANPADEGRIRQQPVEIGCCAYKPLTIPAQIEALFDIILQKGNKISDPFEQAFFMLVHIPYLQPFVDINKRTSRLAANIPLIKENLCPLTFLDVTEQAYSRAILGLYETAQIDLLRDLFVWAYEKSAQKYLTLKQNIAKPSPLRLAYRDVIKQTIYDIVTQPNQDPLTLINQRIPSSTNPSDAENLKSIIIEELKHLHEGSLARYGLRLSLFQQWRHVKNHKK